MCVLHMFEMTESDVEASTELTFGDDVILIGASKI